MKKPVVLIDMDGTIADYDKSVLCYLESMSNEEELKLINSYKGDVWKMFKENPTLEQRRHVITRQEGWWKNLPVIDHNMCLVENLYDMGCEIHILTKGPMTKPNAWKEKLEWAHDNINFPFQMNIVSDKSLFYGKILFDDHPPYVESWLNHRPRGLAIVPQNPSNRWFDHEQVVKFDDTLSAYSETIKMLAKFLDSSDNSDILKQKENK